MLGAGDSGAEGTKCRTDPDHGPRNTKRSDAVSASDRPPGKRDKVRQKPVQRRPNTASRALIVSDCSMSVRTEAPGQGQTCAAKEPCASRDVIERAHGPLALRMGGAHAGRRLPPERLLKRRALEALSGMFLRYRSLCLRARPMPPLDQTGPAPGFCKRKNREKYRETWIYG